MFSSSDKVSDPKKDGDSRSSSRSKSRGEDKEKKKKEKKDKKDKEDDKAKKRLELERKKKEIQDRIRMQKAETGGGDEKEKTAEKAKKKDEKDEKEEDKKGFRGSFRKKKSDGSPETPHKGSTNGKDDDKKSKKEAREAKQKEERERKEKLKQEKNEQKKAEKQKKSKEKEGKKDGGEKKRLNLKLSGSKTKDSTPAQKSKTVRRKKSDEAKKALLNSALIGRSVPNFKAKTERRKHPPTFITGFELNPYAKDSKERSLSMLFDDKKKAELQMRKMAGQARPASGYTSALLDYESPKQLQRTTSFISRTFDSNTPKVQQLLSMKGSNFWFSTSNFSRDREEGKRKASEDSVESQLSMKWDDFMASLPKIEKPRQGKVRDAYSEQGVKELESQGAKILSALQFKATTPDRSSVASKFAVKGGEQQPGVAPATDPAKPEIDKVVLPSYLKGFTGDEPLEPVAPSESGRVAKYAVCILEKSNPRLAEEAQYDMLFGECGSEDPGVYIWRLEYFMPLEIPEEEYPDPDADEPQRGVLYSEDCYIILHITAMHESKKFTIFTWIGKKATRDKVGAAAIRSRELNILLKNKARLSREVEGEESDDFLEIYDYDPLYKSEGGTESGFKPALPYVQEARMYRLHFTKEKIRKSFDSDELVEAEVFNMTQVRMSALSLTKSDVFILDGGTDGWLWQWSGSKAPKKLRFKGHEIMTRINRYEKACRSTEIYLEEGEERNVYTKLREKKKITNEEIDEFYDPRNAEPEPDEEDERSFWDYMKEREYADDGRLPEAGPPIACDVVFCKTAINPETNKPILVTLKKATDPGPLSLRMLDSSAAFIMDADTCLFVWIGKKSSPLERQISRAIAKKFKENQKDRASWAPIIEVLQGAEPTCFITKFPDWCSLLFAPLPSNYATAQHTRYRIAPPNPEPTITFDMLTDEHFLEPEHFEDDCQGTVEVWAIEDGKPTFTKLPAEERGHFHTKDCYLVLYTYYDKTDRMKQAYLCYFWEGRSSIASRWWPAFLFGFYPVLEKKIKTYGGRPPLKVRVTEHKEPDHFCRLFGGNIIIHKGHRKPSNEVTLRIKQPKKKEMFHIRRNTDTVTHTVQVRAQPKSLHSGDAFILLTPEKAYLWYGSGTGFNDSNSFLSAINCLKGNRDMEQLDEGEEVPAFWNTLGGWTAYVCNNEWTQKYKVKPRLYCFSTSSGRLTVEEVLLYYQSDLKSTNVYILDTMHEVYTWAGKRASESLYKQVLDFANKYVREMALRRKKFVELISITEAEEPIEFTLHFHTWATKDPFLDPILAREEKYIDLLFQEYKKKEQEDRKTKERKAMQRDRETPLLRLDWMEIVRREIPDLVVDDGEEEEYSSGSEYEYGDEGENEGNGEDGAGGGRGEGDGGSSSDSEFVYEDLSSEEEEETKAPEKTVAEYFIDKINQESRHYKLYRNLNK